jgi:hypothetical protein
MIHIGGSVALLYASKDLDTLETANFDQKIGVQIIQNALKVLKKLFMLSFEVFLSCSCHLMIRGFCRPQCILLLQTLG